MTLELLEAAPGPDRDARQGLSASAPGSASRDGRARPALQERDPAREHDAAIHDVRGELGRRLVERRLHRVDDERDGLVESASDLSDEMDHVFGRPVIMSRPRTSAEALPSTVRRSDLELDLLGRLLATSSLYSFLMWLTIASSISSPPTRIDWETTIPPRR
jgi:hypothetical protein